MGRVTTRPFTAGDLDTAAELLAARQQRDRQRHPSLGAHLTSAAGARALVEPLARNDRAAGVVAARDGRPVGFLIGEQQLFAPHEMAYLFVPPHSIAMPVEGHAIAGGEDATEVYRAMYMALASDWVAQGFFIHRLNIVPDADVQEAWVALGFGRYYVAGTRPTADPVPDADMAAARIEVHVAGSEDIDVVMRLSDHLMAFHNGTPMFWPVLPTTDGAQRALNLAELESGANPYFVAYRDGQPVAMQTFLRPGFTPPVIDHAQDVYLFEGVVDETIRGGGIGAALLSHTMAWARDAGIPTSTLHYAAGNPTGGPFWKKHGFAAVEYTMERRIDERVAWAKGRAD